MYKTRIKSWGLDKNFKESEVVELFRLRRERERVGKPRTVYTIRGREVDWERVHTYVRRKGLDIATLVDAATSASGPSPSSREVTCRTPSPEPERFTSPASTTSSISSSSTATAATSPRDMRTALPTGPSSYLSPGRSAIRPESARPASTSPSPQPLVMSPDRIRAFQRFLSWVYDTVLFEDGDRVWGTTEYWVRNTRSQEWIMTVRVKLALYRDYFSVASGGVDRRPSTSAATVDAAAPRGFRTINRAFAMLEPLSANIIGTRMYYLTNFLFSFSILPQQPSRPPAALSAEFGGGARNPFAATVAQLVESMSVACAMPVMGGSEGGGSGCRPGNAPPTGLRFPETGEPDFRESAGLLLAKVLEQMVRMTGVSLPKETVLLLEEEDDGYPVLPEDWHPRQGRGGPSGQKSADISGVEAFEMAMWHLSRREDTNAEEYLVGLVEAVSALPSSSSAREAKALARCAHYHLARLWGRRGVVARARDYTRKAVEGSLFFDSFVGWDEAEFLFV